MYLYKYIVAKRLQEGIARGSQYILVLRYYF